MLSRTETFLIACFNCYCFSFVIVAVDDAVVDYRAAVIHKLVTMLPCVWIYILLLLLLTILWWIIAPLWSMNWWRFFVESGYVRTKERRQQSRDKLCVMAYGVLLHIATKMEHLFSVCFFFFFPGDDLDREPEATKLQPYLLRLLLFGFIHDRWGCLLVTRLRVCFLPFDWTRLAGLLFYYYNLATFPPYFSHWERKPQENSLPKYSCAYLSLIVYYFWTKRKNSSRKSSIL